MSQTRRVTDSSSQCQKTVAPVPFHTMIFSPNVQYQTSAYFQSLMSTLCTPLNQKTEKTPLLLPLALPHNKLRRREPFPLDLHRCHGASFRFSDNGGNTRFCASLPMSVCGCHCCLSCSCYQFSVCHGHTCTSVSRPHSQSISGHEIPRSVTQCGCACAILQARFLRA